MSALLIKSIGNDPFRDLVARKHSAHGHVLLSHRERDSLRPQSAMHTPAKINFEPAVDPTGSRAAQFPADDAPANARSRLQP
jgi:hypothetical protein